MMVGSWAPRSARAALAHSPATTWSVPRPKTVTIFVAIKMKRKKQKNYKKCSSLILMNL